MHFGKESSTEMKEVCCCICAKLQGFALSRQHLPTKLSYIGRVALHFQSKRRMALDVYQLGFDSRQYSNFYSSHFKISDRYDYFCQLTLKSSKVEY